MRPTIYVTEHQISQVVCRHFAQGSDGILHPATHLRGGPAVVYGLLRGCGDIIRSCEWLGRDYFHIDNGYYRPGHYDGYYRVTKNGFQRPPLERPPDRWESVGTIFRPWRRSGKHILVVPPSSFVAKWNGIDLQKWQMTVANEIEKYTDRPVRFKPEKGRMDEALEGVWCTVVFNSMAALHGLREGIPTIPLFPAHAAQPVGWDFSDIESPWWPEREPWAWGLAYEQFTLEEFADGTAWEILTEADPDGT